RHTRCLSDWSSDVCSSDLTPEYREKLRSAGASEELLALIHDRAKPKSVEPVVIAPRTTPPKEGGLSIACGPAECEIAVGGVPKEIGRASCRERGWETGGGG